MALSIYSPEDVILLLAGVIPVDGYTDGTFITIKKSLANYTSKTSSDGVISRVYNDDSSFSVTLTLSQFSSSNDVLSNLAKVDQISRKGSSSYKF